MVPNRECTDPKWRNKIHNERHKTMAIGYVGYVLHHDEELHYTMIEGMIERRKLSKKT